MRRSIKPLMVLINTIFIACGGAPTSKGPVLAMSANPLGDTLARMQQGPQGKASLTFALFGGDELRDDKKLNQIADGINRTILGAQLPASKRFRPFIVVASIDGSLPIDIDRLARASTDHAQTLKASSYVAFVRFLGPPINESLHVKAAGQIATELSSRAGLLADMSTQRLFSPAAWRKWVKASDWLADQIVPDIQRNNDGTLTFYTRGMAKFGLPDVEWFGVSQKSARRDFERFQKIVDTIRNQGQARLGQTIAGRTLIECRRPSEAIERECVGL